MIGRLKKVTFDPLLLLHRGTLQTFIIAYEIKLLTRSRWSLFCFDFVMWQADKKGALLSFLLLLLTSKRMVKKSFKTNIFKVANFV